MGSIVLVVFLGYFIGNFSTAFILGKAIKKVDIRSHGSGNAGATNALRVFGLKMGAITFLIDSLKGATAALIGYSIYGWNGALIAGVAVVIGHNWPIFLKFKGGKGIASTIGVVLATNYKVALICIIIGLLIVIKTRYVSLGSITAMALLPIISIIIVKPFSIDFLIFSLILSIMAIYRHKSNIFRLLNGEESKIGQKIKTGGK